MKASGLAPHAQCMPVRFSLSRHALCPQLSRKRLAHSGSKLRLTTTSVAAIEDPAVEFSFASAEVPVAEEAAVPVVEEIEETEKGSKTAAYKYFGSLVKKRDLNRKTGDRVVGTVFSVDTKGVNVDIGGKAFAFVPKSELSLAPIDKVSDVLQPDSVREFIVIAEERKSSHGSDRGLLLSLKQLELEVNWRRLEQIKDEDVTVIATVTGSNKGGLLVSVEHMTAFIPASHLPHGFINNPEFEIGTSVPVKFLDIGKDTNRVVCSAKRANASNVAIRTVFKMGEVALGRVVAVKPYGAFVDIGGVNGLLHISQITHDRISTVESILKEGDQIKVLIVGQDQDKGRVSLSTKKLEPTPGDMVRDPSIVFARAEEMAAVYREQLVASEARYRADLKNTENSEAFSV